MTMLSLSIVRHRGSCFGNHIGSGPLAFSHWAGGVYGTFGGRVVVV